MATEWEPAFKVCYHCGSPEIEREAASVFACRQCGKHLFVNPVSAVAGVLVDAEERILLLERAREPAKGKLGLPGGFLDPGETGEEGLRREIREETGLEIGGVQYLGSFPNNYVYDGTTYLVLDLFFWARIESFADARALDEVAGICPINVNEIDFEELAFSSIKKALTKFRQEFPIKLAND